MPTNSKFEELPLFPLHMVVFPGQVVPLHIFEERYKAMFARILAAQPAQFAVVAIQSGAEVGDAAVKTYRIGALVEVLQSFRLNQGRLHIMAKSQGVLEIESSDASRPYLTASGRILARPFPALPADEQTHHRRTLLALAQEYLRLYQIEPDLQLDGALFPENLEAFLNHLTPILPLANDRKQDVLEAENLTGMADELEKALRHAIHNLQILKAAKQGRGTGPEDWN